MEYINLGHTGLKVSRDLPGMHDLRKARPRANCCRAGRPGR